MKDTSETHHYPDHRRVIAVVVNDRTVAVEVKEDVPLRSVIPKVLEEVGDSEKNIEGWELRDASGTRLELGEKIKDFDFPRETILFLHRVHRHRLVITVVVNGDPAEIRIDEEAPLRSVIPKALEETGNVGQAIDNWELKDSSGTLLELDRKIEDFGFTHETILFLSLKAGVAGG